MSGYVVDTTYTDTFFRELSPAWLNYVAALNGVSPRPLGAAFRYLELGCGFGTSAIVNAAAFPHASFDACDFNASHVEGGRGYATQLGVDNIHLRATSFQDLLAADIAPYDFIVMHGVYSWVDAATRGVLRQLVARLLLPGGLLYVSYNALPGWSTELPLRKLLLELAATENGTAAETSERAAATIEALSRASLRFFSANPAATSAVEAYTRGEGRYLAHEFMNAAWEPFYGVDVADEFSPIGVRLVGSATLVNNHLPLILEAASARAIARLTSPRQRQLGIDFAINQRFRRDVFVRADVTAPRSDSYLDATVIGCVTDVDEIGTTARVPRGAISFQEPFVRDVRALFAAGSWSFAEAVDRLTHQGQDRAGVARNLVFLVASGVLMPFARRYQTPTTKPTRLANAMVERAVTTAGESRLKPAPARRPAGVKPATTARSAVRPARSGRHFIPSHVVGNGVELDAETVAALVEWGRVPLSRSFSRQLTRLSRLGIVV